MKNEHPPLVSKKELLSAVRRGIVMTAIAYLALAPITVNLKTSRDVISALNGEGRSCSFSESYDVAAVLGAGVYKTPEGDYHPTTFGRGRLNSASALYLNDLVDEIVLLDGYQGKEADPATGKKYFMEQVWTMSDQTVRIPQRNVHVESKSTSTATNIDALGELMIQNGWDDVAVVTDGFHDLRVKAILKIKGINACVFTVERITEELNPSERKTVRINNRNQGKAWRETMEKIKLFVLFYDPQQKRSAQLEKLIMGLTGE